MLGSATPPWMCGPPCYRTMVAQWMRRLRRDTRSTGVFRSRATMTELCQVVPPSLVWKIRRVVDTARMHAAAAELVARTVPAMLMHLAGRQRVGAVGYLTHVTL